VKLCNSGNRQKNPFPDKRPLFYYITDRRQLTGIDLIDCIRRAVDWGVDFIQIRERDLSDKALYELACEAVTLARGKDCRILINGRADIALAAAADGVHLPSTGLHISDISSWIPKDFLVGVSVHSLTEARLASEQAADYVLLGHIFPTKSKLSYGSPLGLDYLREVCSIASIPVFGLGGMVRESIQPVLESGAVGIAGISLFQEAAMSKWQKFP
jgi:thiamine-phosphate pyrophosphorylase